MSESENMARSDPLDETLLLILDDKYVPAECRPISCDIFWMELKNLVNKLGKLQEAAAYGRC